MLGDLCHGLPTFAVRSFFHVRNSHAKIICSPILDCPLDMGLRELLGHSFLHQAGDFSIRGKTKHHQLPFAQFADSPSQRFGKQACKSLALFQSNNTILRLEGIKAGFDGKDGDCDYEQHHPPVEPARPLHPMNDRDKSREANHWKRKEVEEWVVAGVICRSLWRFLAHNFNLLGAPSIVEAWFGGIEDGGSWKERLVELTGIEPVASSLRTRISFIQRHSE